MQVLPCVTTLPGDNGTAELPIELRKMTSGLFCASNTERPNLLQLRQCLKSNRYLMLHGTYCKIFFLKSFRILLQASITSSKAHLKLLSVIAPCAF